MFRTACEQDQDGWHIQSLCVQWKTHDGQRNCPKHVEFYSKNKFKKLVHLVGFIIGMICCSHSHVSCCLFISLHWFPAPGQIGPGAHPASCAASTSLSPAGKAAGVWPLPPTHPSSAEVKERVELCLYSPLGLYGLFCGELCPFYGWYDTYIHTYKF